MKKTLLTLAAIAVVAVACDDDDNYVIPTPVDRVVVGVNGDTTRTTFDLPSATATQMPTLSAFAFPDNATNKEIYWLSSEPGVISIDSKTGVMTRSDSVLTQISNVVITARAVNALDGTVTIRLGEGEFVDGVTINNGQPVNLSAKLDATMPKLTATVSPATATDKTVTWSSSDPSIVTIDAAGQLTRANKVLTDPATVIITAKAVNGVIGTTEVVLGKDEFKYLEIEGEDLINPTITAGECAKQEGWIAGLWSNNFQLFWNMNNLASAAAINGQTLTATFNSTDLEGDVNLRAKMTLAGDFGTYKIEINDEVVVASQNFNDPNLITKEYMWPAKLVKGTNTVKVTSVDSAPRRAVFGIDKFTFITIVE